MSEGSQWWIVAAMLAPPIFLLYDHLLTLGMEVQYIWLKRKRRSAYWFFLLRYFASFGEIVMLVFRFYDAGSESGCLVLQTYINTHTLLVELLVALAGSLIPLVGWSVAVSSIGTALLQGMICGKIFPEQKASYLTVTWGCALAYDLTIFILTLWKTIKTRRCFRGSLPVRLPLLDIMLRDGLYRCDIFWDNEYCPPRKRLPMRIPNIQYVSVGSDHFRNNDSTPDAQSPRIRVRRSTFKIHNDGSKSHFNF
ncbi:hypothetical protein VKT23_002490 [Stygiomarasmius scandens]|uniref:DUF6533 domain-containing protein n=1 Tax=Marasmiellus scandens TaxID=2682957 RepID=A0ABR1K261_9AGAR